MVEDDETYLIDLGFVSLRYPEQWQKAVTVKDIKKHAATDKFTLQFVSKDTNLFDLYFNEEKGNLLGTLKTKDGNTVLYIKTYKLENAGVELIAQQEALNVIIQGLISDYDFLVNERPEVEDDYSKTYEIKTDLVTLHYPEKWKSKATVNTEKNVVHFYNGKTPLFDLRFEECDGYLLGTYSGTPIYMVEYPVTKEEDIAMQQDVNIIIQNLSKDKNFVINQ